MNETEQEIYREYDLRGLFDEARQRVLNKYARGDISEEELHEKIGNVVENATTAERLKGDIMKMKAKKLEEAEEQYANDEITEEELEQRMDELFENGDDFLDVDLDEQKKAEARAEQKDEVLFRAKEIGQLIGYAIVAAIVIGAVAITKGQIIPPLFVLAIFGWIAYSIYAGVWW